MANSASGTWPATDVRTPVQVPPALEVRGLTKRYGDTEVLAGVDLEIASGELLAVVGPNGAGKTTMVEILEGYRARDGGTVSVLGTDPAQPTRQWRARIGIVLQTCQLPAELTAWELVERFAGYYPSPRPVAETLELVGLGDRGDARAGTLSGGQQRRLDMAMALVGDPELLFLDEPTTGFDPSARHQAWSVITRLRALGTTIVLTTHYMEEAEALADRVAVVVAGRVVAQGTPQTLGGRDQAPATIRFRLPTGADREQLPELPGGAVSLDRRGTVEIVGADLLCLGALVDWARERQIDLVGLTVQRPSLEEVYLQCTGGRR
jgi:ABC-2 type transport system ATP-binding protein